MSDRTPLLLPQWLSSCTGHINSQFSALPFSRLVFSQISDCVTLNRSLSQRHVSMSILMVIIKDYLYCILHGSRVIFIALIHTSCLMLLCTCALPLHARVLILFISPYSLLSDLIDGKDFNQHIIFYGLCSHILAVISSSLLLLPHFRFYCPYISFYCLI